MPDLAKSILLFYQKYFLAKLKTLLICLLSLNYIHHLNLHGFKDSKLLSLKLVKSYLNHVSRCYYTAIKYILHLSFILIPVQKYSR